VQLLDGETGSHVWADRFDTDRHDLAEAQREIVGRLASPLAFELVRDVSRRIEQENVANPDPRDLSLRARVVRLQTLAPNVQARREMVALLERALILDPDNVDARNELAVILVNGVAEAVSTSIEQDIARAEQLLSEAVERDPNRSEVHKTMGFLRRVQGRWSESQVELERAIELDPNNYVAIRQLGITLLAQGKPDAAIPHFERALPAEARQQHQFNGYCQLGRCHLFSGRNAEAVGLFRRARTLAPGIFYVHLDLAGALGLGGNLDEAKREIAEALKLKPEINSIGRWRALSVTQGMGHQQFQALREKTTYAGLRAAGFPEE
jgi:tetratricopeptide (TPR) repeat protein